MAHTLKKRKFNETFIRKIIQVIKFRICKGFAAFHIVLLFLFAEELQRTTTTRLFSITISIHGVTDWNTINNYVS